jgi:hypothetical protein
MQGIYNYMSKTNHVSKVYSFAAGLCLQFVLLEICFVLCVSNYRIVCSVHDIRFPLQCRWDVSVFWDITQH